MKGMVLLALLGAGAAAFFFMGGSEMIGGQPTDLPETITPPNATFVGNEQSNPFVE